MLKRIIASLFCLLFIFVSIPIFGFTDFFSASVYADDSLDGWRNATTNDEFAEAFRYYCKSRDLTMDGTVANVLTNGSTNIFNALCDGIGINVTALQGHIKYEVDSSGNKGLKWLFDSQGITFYNRLFAQFLQDNDLEVGDSVDDKVVFSGKWFQDDDGNGCFLYSTNGTSNTLGSLISTGTNYLYPYSVYKQCVLDGTTPANLTTHIFNKQYDFTYSYLIDSRGGQYENYRLWGYIAQQGNSSTQSVILANYRKSDGAFNNVANQGIYCIAINNQGRLFLCKSFADNSGIISLFVLTPNTNTAESYPTGHITINSTVINNNNYEGDTIINNEGDIVNPPADNPPGGNDPGWNVGGGQGSYNDGQGNNYTINFPDFELPDLNIDWSISGLGNKFPFSIPFDIASLVTVLNAEPEAPRFQGTLNLGITTYDYDINLQQFDSVAHACRIAELLLLVFGLILITRSIIKG